MVSETKLSKQAQLLIFAVALLVRAGYVLAQYRFGIVGGAFVSSDSAFYIEIAKNILAGAGFASQYGSTAYVAPGFPVFLAGCFSIFGDNPMWTSLVQCVLSALVCVFIAAMTANMFGRRAGVIAGIIAAVYYELVLWTSGQILTEPLYTFLLASAVYALVSAAVEGSGAGKNADLKFALAGLLFGLSALVRPLALAVAIGIGILMILVSLFYQRERLKGACIFVAVCLLVMQPWGLRNYFVMDQYLLTSSESGHVLWGGNNPEYDLYEHPDFTRFGGYSVMFQPPPELRQELKGATEMEANQIYARRARQHIYSNPSAFFLRALHKTWNMWRPTFGGSSFPNKLISYSFYPLLLVLSVAGIFLAWLPVFGKLSVKNLLLDLTHPFGLLGVLLLIHLLLHAVFNGEIRFRVPLWIALIPFASLTIISIYDSFAPLRRATIKDEAI